MMQKIGEAEDNAAAAAAIAYSSWKEKRKKEPLHDDARPPASLFTQVHLRPFLPSSFSDRRRPEVGSFNGEGGERWESGVLTERGRGQARLISLHCT